MRLDLVCTADESWPTPSFKQLWTARDNWTKSQWWCDGVMHVVKLHDSFITPLIREVYPVHMSSVEKKICKMAINKSHYAEHHVTSMLWSGIKLISPERRWMPGIQDWNVLQSMSTSLFLNICMYDIPHMLQKAKQSLYQSVRLLKRLLSCDCYAVFSACWTIWLNAVLLPRLHSLSICHISYP